jgi:hypothetical protein
MTDRKFYRTRIVVEVLSDYQLPDGTDLESIHYEITQGGCSGVSAVESEREIDGREAVRALIQQGSEPAFFGLDEDGNDIE